MQITSWTAFKDICIAKKNLNLQYEEFDDRYHIIGPDANGINWHITLLKNIPDPQDPSQTIVNPDVTDFLDNVESSCNWPVGTRPYAFSTSDFEFDGNGVFGICTAGNTVNLDYQIDPVNFPIGQNLNGAMVVFEGSMLGDWVEFKVVDASNLLPPPLTGATLKQWVRKWYVPACPVGLYGIPITLQTSYAGRVPPGMWLRMIYHSVGQTDVKIGINYFLHTPS